MPFTCSTPFCYSSGQVHKFHPNDEWFLIKVKDGPDIKCWHSLSKNLTNQKRGKWQLWQYYHLAIQFDSIKDQLLITAITHLALWMNSTHSEKNFDLKHKIAILEHDINSHIGKKVANSSLTKMYENRAKLCRELEKMEIVTR